MKLTYILIALVLAFALGGGAYLAKKKEFALRTARRIAAAALILAATFRYLLEREAIFEVRGLNMFSPFGDNIPQTVLAVFLVWFSFAALATIAMDQIFDFRTLHRIATFFGAPMLAVDILFFGTYATAISGESAFAGFDVRAFVLAIEIGLGLGLVAAKLLDEKTPLPTKKEIGTMFAVLPFAILAFMPGYVPQAFIGYLDASVNVNDLTLEHRIILYIGLLLPFTIFHVLKNKSYEVKRFAMIYMSYAWLWTYLSSYTFASFADPLSWPLHLCNTAMFLFPLCLTFKMDRLFYFCLFINVMGSFLAMLMPNTSASVNALATDRIIFWVNHYPAFFSPVLFIALKIFKRPRFKEWVYALSAFVVYFILMLIINAWFTNYGDVDYFFLNSDFVVGKLGKWAEDTRNFTVSFNIKDLTFTFYPLYQTLFFIVYVLFTVGIWFLYEILFSSWDAAEDKRLRERDYKKMKKELLAFLGGKAVTEPISGDDSPRIQLKGFSKKYGTNKHYSVENANLDVHGGEIFGFLGPNGAGKSTIIKSIVGIQTITSGSIEICGYDVEKQPVQSKLNIGFVPDHYALYENLTGREYINYIADLYRVSRKDRDETIEKYVKNFQLVGSFDNQMKTYSHGMKQKIAIMAALVHNPKVWILDEPLTGLDPTSIHEVKECMKEHAAKGNIVFFSSHIIDVVEKICDRIAIIKKGKIRAEATIKELEEKGIELESFYLQTIYGSAENISVADIEAAEKSEPITEGAEPV